jgi:hypothetical protein
MVPFLQKGFHLNPGPLDPLNPSDELLLIFKVGMTRSFNRDHARTNGVFWLTDFFEQATFQRALDSLKHFSTKTLRMLLRRLHVDIKIPDIHFFVRILKKVSAVGNESKSSPMAFTVFEYLINLAHCGWISLFVDDPPILNLNGRAVVFDLLEEHPNTLENVQRLKARDHSRSAIVS